LRGAEPAAPEEGPAARTRIATELAAGIRFIAGQPLVRAVVATAGINNLARSVAMGVAILYLVDVARLSAAEIGIVFAAGHSGFVIGALASRRVTARLGMGRTMQVGVGLFGPSMLCFAVAPAEWAGPAFGLMVFAHGLGIAIHNVNQVTVRQTLTPDHLRARVAAVVRLVIFGAIPVGTIIGGLIAEIAGLRTALLVSGVALLLGSVPYLGVRITRLRSIDQLTPSSAAQPSPSTR
jgi:MFS family permease